MAWTSMRRISWKLRIVRQACIPDAQLAVAGGADQLVAVRAERDGSDGTWNIEKFEKFVPSFHVPQNDRAVTSAGSKTATVTVEGNAGHVARVFRKDPHKPARRRVPNRLRRH